MQIRGEADELRGQIEILGQGKVLMRSKRSENIIVSIFDLDDEAA